MAASRKARYTTDEVLDFFKDDDNESQCDSSDEEYDFTKYIGVIDVSDASEEEECPRTQYPVSEQLSRDDITASDLPNVSELSSNIELDVSKAAESSILESSAFDLWQSSESEDSERDDSESRTATQVTMQDHDSEVKDITSEEEGSIWHMVYGTVQIVTLYDCHGS